MQRTSADFMINLIEDILDYSKMKFGKFDLNLSWFSIYELVDEVLGMVDFQAVDRNVKLEKDIPRLDYFREIYSDKKRIKQVLLNLVSNALKFTFNGKISLKVKLTKDDNDHPNDSLVCADINESIDGHHLLIVEVCDAGIGISEEDQRKLF